MRMLYKLQTIFLGYNLLIIVQNLILYQTNPLQYFLNLESFYILVTHYYNYSILLNHILMYLIFLELSMSNQYLHHQENFLPTNSFYLDFQHLYLFFQYLSTIFHLNLFQVNISLKQTYLFSNYYLIDYMMFYFLSSKIFP
jgi:hypothetical protein